MSPVIADALVLGGSGPGSIGFFQKNALKKWTLPVFELF